MVIQVTQGKSEGDLENCVVTMIELLQCKGVAQSETNADLREEGWKVKGTRVRIGITEEADKIHTKGSCRKIKMDQE